MKRHGNLWPMITAEENIKLAYKKAKRLKSKHKGVIRFKQNEEENLKFIRKLLVDKTFHTGRYYEKVIYEPKKRTVYVLPFHPDRIVHHALMNIVIPIWQPMFINDSYACIDGRGIHSGSTRTMEFVRRNDYCLKCDISKFYPSIPHDKLMELVERKIKCKDTLWLFRDIIYSFPGDRNIPIGNFTSQWLGNLYMNEMDTFVKHQLGVKDYLRYCDDFLLFHRDKAFLSDAAKRINEFAWEHLSLTLSKCDLFPVSRGVDFLGYRHFKRFKLLRKRTAKRVAKRLGKIEALYAAGKITAEQCRSTLASAKGWITWANAYNFQKRVRLEELTAWARAECELQRELIAFKVA